MSRSMIPSQQKLAEKLLILRDRGKGMLTRIYNIKKVGIGRGFGRAYSMWLDISSSKLWLLICIVRSLSAR